MNNLQVMNLLNMYCCTYKIHNLQFGIERKIINEPIFDKADCKKIINKKFSFLKEKRNLLKVRRLHQANSDLF